MQELPADVLKALGNLPPGELAKIRDTLLNDGAIVKVPKKDKVVIEEVLHHYHCEFCEKVKEKSYPVNVTNGKQGVRSFVEPIVLYHVCDECKGTIVIGLAYALMMRGAIQHESIIHK